MYYLSWCRAVDLTKCRHKLNLYSMFMILEFYQNVCQRVTTPKRWFPIVDYTQRGDAAVLDAVAVAADMVALSREFHPPTNISSLTDHGRGKRLYEARRAQLPSIHKRCSNTRLTRAYSRLCEHLACQLKCCRRMPIQTRSACPVAVLQRRAVTALHCGATALYCGVTT